MDKPRVAVIGAGVVGLSTASHLLERGAEVRLYDKAEPGSLQSKGLTRIFRTAHGDPRLVRQAQQALEGWRAWEERLGRRLVGDDGLVVTGTQTVEQWSHAMEEAEAPYDLITERYYKTLLPIAHLPVFPALFDLEGGATRARRTIEFLRREVAAYFHRTEVHKISQTAHGCTVATDQGDWECDECILAAGINTVTLAAPLDLAIPQRVLLHSRFTFELRDEYRDRSLACWIDDSGLIGGIHSYGQPVGHSGRYAVGVSWEGQEQGPEIGEEEVSRQSRERAIAYVQEALPGLIPEPVDEIRCAFPEYAFSQGGDGFTALRKDGVTAFYGNNVFKFAPLLGKLLAETALEEQVAVGLA